MFVYVKCSKRRSSNKRTNFVDADFSQRTISDVVAKLHVDVGTFLGKSNARSGDTNTVTGRPLIVPLHPSRTMHPIQSEAESRLSEKKIFQIRLLRQSRTVPQRAHITNIFHGF